MHFSGWVKKVPDHLFRAGLFLFRSFTFFLFQKSKFLMSAARLKSRDWVLTVFDLKAVDALKHENSVYLVVGPEEKCPTTGRKHRHGFIQFRNPRALRALKAIRDLETVHFEPRKGSPSEAREYCLKEGAPLVESGSLKQRAAQGKRSDLLEVSNLIMSKASISQVALKFPVQFIKYHKGISALVEVKSVQESAPDRNIFVLCLWGKAGVGKTRWVYRNFPLSSFFKVTASSCTSNLWFDGYSQEEILLIDDFNGWIKYTSLLAILDRYPLIVQRKGTNTCANWKFVVITSNVCPRDWYPGVPNIDGLLRRVGLDPFDEAHGKSIKCDEAKNLPPPYSLRTRSFLPADSAVHPPASAVLPPPAASVPRTQSITPPLEIAVNSGSGPPPLSLPPPVVTSNQQDCIEREVELHCDEELDDMISRLPNTPPPDPPRVVPNAVDLTSDDEDEKYVPPSDSEDDDVPVRIPNLRKRPPRKRQRN